AADEIGGRLRFETRLPGLAAWGRVLDWRRAQLERLPNVSIYRGNRLTAEEILELGNTHVVIATGARWARLLYSALEIPAGRLEGPGIFTPDDVAEGARIEGPVAVYDFDNYYMGSVVAEHLARSGQRVAYVTPAAHAEELTAAGIRSVTRIGDALAPGAIVHAVYSGHRYARELDADPATLGFRRDAPLARHTTPAAASRAARGDLERLT